MPKVEVPAKIETVEDKKRRVFIDNVNSVANEVGAYGHVVDPLLKRWFDFVRKQRANGDLPPDNASLVDEIL